MSNLWDHAQSDIKQRVRSAITDAAATLLDTRGLSSISMKDLAFAAGISRQTLYKHFSNVEAALVSYLLDEIGAVQEATARLMESTDDPVARLEVFMKRAIKRASGRDIQLAIQTVLSPEGEAMIREAVARIHDHVRKALEDGIDTGRIRADLDPEIASALIFGILEATAGMISRGVPPKRVSAQAVAMVREAVVSRPSDSVQARSSNSPDKVRRNL